MNRLLIYIDIAPPAPLGVSITVLPVRYTIRKSVALNISFHLNAVSVQAEWRLGCSKAKVIFLAWLRPSDSKENPMYRASYVGADCHSRSKGPVLRLTRTWCSSMLACFLDKLQSSRNFQTHIFAELAMRLVQGSESQVEKNRRGALDILQSFSLRF